MEKPAVYMARAAGYEDRVLDVALQRVLDGLGGLGSLLSGASTVLLKPNFLMPRKVETAVTTHPQFIAAVARAVRGAHSGRLLLGDGPAMGTTTTIARKLGLIELIEPYDVELVDFGETVTVSGGGGFGAFQMARPLIEADAVINLPKVKTHGQMYFTCAVKNSFGAFVGMDKPRLHLTAGRDYTTFAKMLLEVSRRVGPVLTLADGVVGMQGNGPGNGDPRALELIAGGCDPVAVDRVLMEVLGLQVKAAPVMVEARAQGEPGAEIRNVELLGDALDTLSVTDFEPAVMEPVATAGVPRFLARPLRRLWTTRPVFDHEKCTRCGQCSQQCAAEALDLQPRGRRSGGPTDSVEYMAVDLSKCIRCYCCQEICPEAAITVGQGRFLRAMRRIEGVLTRTAPRH